MGFSLACFQLFHSYTNQNLIGFRRNHKPTDGKPSATPIFQDPKGGSYGGGFPHGIPNLKSLRNNGDAWGILPTFAGFFRFSTRVETVAFQFDRSNASSRPARSRRSCPTSAGTLARGYGGFHQWEILEKTWKKQYTVCGTRWKRWSIPVWVATLQGGAGFLPYTV